MPSPMAFAAASTYEVSGGKERMKSLLLGAPLALAAGPFLALGPALLFDEPGFFDEPSFATLRILYTEASETSMPLAFALATASFAGMSAGRPRTNAVLLLPLAFFSPVVFFFFAATFLTPLGRRPWLKYSVRARPVSAV